MSSMNRMQQSRTDQLMKSIRQNPVFRALVPLEAGIGWPLPLVHNKRVYFTLPFFGMAPLAGQNEIAIFAPFSSMTLDWLTGHVVDYCDYRFRSPWRPIDLTKPIGFFPHSAVEKLSTAEYLAKREELTDHYDQLFDTMAQGGDLPPFWIREFKELLELLVEPALRPFCRVIAPKFYANFIETR